MATTVSDLDTAAAVLHRARTRRADADRTEADLLAAAVEWAQLHPATSLDDAAVLARYGDHALAIAGPGAPLVAEFCLAEFAAAIRVPTEVGKHQLGEALELRYRLPKVWARVGAGDLAAWRARRIARETISLTGEAAGYVDTQIATFAHRVRPSEVDRLVADAICRHMPEEARGRRTQAADGRHLNIGSDQVTFNGTSFLHGELDLADALDLETALATGAATLKAAGSEESLDVRRSQAIGELARRQLSLALAGSEPSPGLGVDCPGGELSGVKCTGDPGASDTTRACISRHSTRPARPKPRQVVLHVHLAVAAITGTNPNGHHPARVERDRQVVTADQVRSWCGNPDTQITVKPVIDLAEQIHVTSYEVPDRLADQAEERDLTCVFPWCTGPASGCDKDHVIPYAAGGQTASDNIADLCRRHHRLKTFSAWGYTVIEPGTYLWTSPHGLQFLRDHTGTQDVTREHRPRPPDG